METGGVGGTPAESTVEEEASRPLLALPFPALSLAEASLFSAAMLAASSCELPLLLGVDELLAGALEGEEVGVEEKNSRGKRFLQEHRDDPVAAVLKLGVLIENKKKTNAQDHTHVSKRGGEYMPIKGKK